MRHLFDFVWLFFLGSIVLQWFSPRPQNLWVVL